MEEFHKTQNKNSCNLSMPEGLKNLMFDISREVLRAQPEDICRFVAEYLSAMLAARESLQAATRMCEALCGGWAPRPLRCAGLSPHEAAEAQNIVNEYLQDDEVTKKSLSARLAEANIDESKIASVKRAVEQAFKRNIIENIPPLGIEFTCNPEATKAAANTLKLYCKPKQIDVDELTVPYGEDNKKVHMKSRESSIDSSDETFENIQSDGDIKDFYVPGNDRPYTNSSLTTLTSMAGYHLPEQENRVISYDEDEKHADDPGHHQAADTEDTDGTEGNEDTKDIKDTRDTKETSADDEILISVDEKFTADTGELPMPGGSANYEDEIIEDYASDAENDSDVSLQEEFEL